MSGSKQDREDKTYNVKQRTFVVTTQRDRLSILRTGYLRPCVAFYGLHRGEGVAFLSHVDGNLKGIEKLTARLDTATKGDLQGFSLYLTANYTLTLRFLALVGSIAAFLLVDGVLAHISWLGIICFVYWFFFRSLVGIWYYAWKVFGKCVTPNTPWQMWGCVEVTVDSASKEGPEVAKKDTLPLKLSLDRYGPPPGWLDGQRDATSDREAHEKVCKAKVGAGSSFES